MVNYKNGKIYRVVNTENETIYIGSTCQTLSNRFSRHNYKGNGNKIILIENYACNCCEELRMREQQVIEKYQNLANQIKAYISPEYRKEYEKEYRENNKEKISQKNKEYKEKNKEKISQKDKEYREANKDKINEYSKQYYEANKEIIKDKNSEKVRCEFCDSLVRKDYIKKHQARKKCLKAQNK